MLHDYTIGHKVGVNIQDPLDLVNFSVIQYQMIETNVLCNFKTTDNTFYLPKADKLRQ